jgi:hypothetical protein
MKGNTLFKEKGGGPRPPKKLAITGAPEKHPPRGYRREQTKDAAPQGTEKNSAPARQKRKILGLCRESDISAGATAIKRRSTNRGRGGAFFPSLFSPERTVITITSFA